MADIFLPTLHTFAMKNEFTGSCGALRFKIVPKVVKSETNPKEVDMAQSRELRDEIHTMICRLPSSPRAAFQAMSIAILCVDKRVYGEEVDYLENYLLP